MIRTILIVVLSIGVIATGYWGYTEHRDKNAILIHAENNYQRSFHELNNYVSQIQDKLGSTLALNSKSSIRPQLADVWHLTEMAHSDVGQLPLSLMPFNKTESFLANMGEFSYRTGIKEQDQKQLTNDEYNTLKKLYGQSSQIEKELRNVQTIAMKNNLRWMDVELALSTQKTPKDNGIIDGLKLVDKTVDGFNNNWGAEMDQMNRYQETRYNNITGPSVSKKEAAQKATSYLGVNKPSKLNVQQLGKGANYPAYLVTYHNPKTNEMTDVNITKQGGYLGWFLANRPIKDQKISLYEASKKAADYLSKKNMGSMTLVQSDQYDHVGVFSFVKTKNNVRLYPTKVTLKVALDNGEIIGFNQVDYLLNHKMVIHPKPKMSKNEMLQQLNKNVKVEETHLAVIKNDLGENILCYEVLGTIKDQTYQLFINANTGKEEQAHVLKNNSSGYAT